MNLLTYTSKEMFSSTELIRKSKMVFEKLHNDEIEKAVILRDGKPSLILMDFEKYEKIIQAYENEEVTKTKDIPIKRKALKPIVEEKKIITSINQIDDLDLQKAFDEIENLDMEIKAIENSKTRETKDVSIDNSSIKKKTKKEIALEKAPLREFWAEND